MSTSGLVVGDADALISLFFIDDKHHKYSFFINQQLDKAGIVIIFPNTAIAEAITTLQRKLSLPKISEYINKQYLKGRFEVNYVNEQIMHTASEIFNPYRSKRNTYFDTIVAATAKTLNADAIFSFDNWYTKLGFKLASEVV